MRYAAAIWGCCWRIPALLEAFGERLRPFTSGPPSSGDSRGALVAALLAVLAFALPARAAETEVRLLRGDTRNGVWGTSEFQVQVLDTGALSLVRMGKHDLIREAASFRTAPLPPDSQEPARSEILGLDENGRTIPKPRLTLRQDRGSRIFRFDYAVTSPAIDAGAPLCRVVQTLTITPRGEIHVVYDCEWTRTLRWHVFQFVVSLDPAACMNHEYVLLSEHKALSGRLTPGSAPDPVTRLADPDQISIWSDLGPIHVVGPPDNSASFSWSGGVYVIFRPSYLRGRAFIYKDRTARVSYSILLPVSQQ